MSDATMGERAARVLKGRLRDSAIAVYGAGLGCDCGECPAQAAECALPTQRPAAEPETAPAEPAPPVEPTGAAVES